MDKEALEGDLKAAIEQYKKIAQSKDRSIAARALLRMAESYRKLGDSESRRIYERIANDYSDQKEEARLAREQLGRKEQLAGPVSRTLWTTPPFPGWGRITPDGRSFSYTQEGDVFLRDVAAGVSRNLTNRPKDSKDTAAPESVISPDGKRVAYVWRKVQDNRYDLRIANLTGDPIPERSTTILKCGTSISTTGPRTASGWPSSCSDSTKPLNLRSCRPPTPRCAC
jgi:hypothetical protein